jgi:hypothetical protein
MNDFTIRPPVDGDVVQILERSQSSRPRPIPQISPGDSAESGIASVEPSNAILSDQPPCPDDSLDAPEDQIRCVSSFDHDAVEIFDSCLAEIPFNVLIMSPIHEDQQLLRFNYPGDILPQITISGQSVSVAMLLCQILQTCCVKFVLRPDERLPLCMTWQFMNPVFETRMIFS